MLDRIKIAWLSKRLDKIPYEYERVLSHYNKYYNNLNSDLKKEFRERVFISSKLLLFKPIQFSSVTEEMKILITSALVQITFGLKKYYLSQFKIIYVAPGKYQLYNLKNVLGHVDHLHKVIVLSWPHVKHGFIIPDDAMNVALHESAHALHGEQLTNSIFNKVFDSDEMKKWENAGIRKILKIRDKRHEYLSDYAGIDMYEMFAVCIECFFEQSKEFKQTLPEMYQLIVELLDQDPINESNPIIVV